MFHKKPNCSKENLHFGQLFTLKFHWLEVVTSSVVLLINRRHMDQEPKGQLVAKALQVPLEPWARQVCGCSELKAHMGTGPSLRSVTSLPPVMSMGMLSHSLYPILVTDRSVYQHLIRQVWQVRQVRQAQWVRQVRQVRQVPYGAV